MGRSDSVSMAQTLHMAGPGASPHERERPPLRGAERGALGPWRVAGAHSRWGHSPISLAAMPAGTSRYSESSMENCPRPWVEPRSAEE